MFLESEFASILTLPVERIKAPGTPESRGSRDDRGRLTPGWGSHFGLGLARLRPQWSSCAQGSAVFGRVRTAVRASSSKLNYGAGDYLFLPSWSAWFP